MKFELTEDMTLVYDGIAVGRFVSDEKRLVLDLGWLDAAGLKITVLGDPAKDRQRKVLERPKDEVRNQAGTDQTKLPVNDGGGSEV